MPNSFTVFPNVLPGNVTIGGNLTVGGDQVRIGAAAPFVRVGKDVASNMELSENLGFDGVTLDSAGVEAFRFFWAGGGQRQGYSKFNTAATEQRSAPQFAIFTDYTAHAHTGTTSTDTIVSKTIPANTLGANGGLRVVAKIGSSAQGASATSLFVTLGANNLGSFNITATGNYLMEVFAGNRNNAGTQIAWARLTNLGTGAILGQTVTLAVDTTADQILAFKIGNGTSTDTQSLDSIIAVQENSFGPV